MKCPRCGKENAENAVTCEGCGLKIATICPRCGAHNKIGQAKCIGCNLTLIRFCPKCKTPNFPNVTNCRKCGAVILKKAAKKPVPQAKPPEKQAQVRTEAPQRPVQKQAAQAPKPKPMPEIKEVQQEQAAQPKPEVSPEITTETEQITVEAHQQEAADAQVEQVEQVEQGEQGVPQESAKKEFSRTEAIVFLEQVLTRSNKGFLVDLAGSNGIGKSTIVSGLAKSITDRKFIWLVGQAEPNHSKIPYSFFRDLLRSLFNVPMLIDNKEELKKNLAKAFEVTLEITDKTALNAVYRILLNEYEDHTGDIEENNNEIKIAIEKIIMGLAAKSSIALVAEDFDYIDRASFDCIKHLIKKGFLEGTNFLFINHSNTANFSKFFPDEIASNKYLMVVIKPSEGQELNLILNNMMNNQDVLPDSVKQRVLARSKGQPIFIEQMLWLMFQTGALYTEQQGDVPEIKFNMKAIDIEVPTDFAELMNKRLEILEQGLAYADKILFTAAAFGYKFSPGIVQQALGIDEQKANEMFQILVNSGIFSVIDSRTLAFKHITLWKAAIERKIEQEEMAQICLKLLDMLEAYPEINNSYRAMLVEQAGDVEKAVYYSHKASDEAFALGDIFSFTENQLKVHKLLSATSLSEEEKETARLSITEQVGRVNYISNPQIAIKYLTESMKKYEEDAAENIVKLIELNGYLSESFDAIGNYLGVIECSEKAIALTDADESSLEVTLINFSKLEAVFNLGRLEEAIMSAKNEILPCLRKAIAKKQALPGLSYNEMKEFEYKTELILAKALIFQGNKDAVDVLDKVLADARKENNEKYELEAMLAQALFATIQGNLKVCEEIYKDIESKNLIPEEPNNAKLEWLFVSMFMNLLVGNIEQARTICYSALSLAKETRNFNLFSLLKLLSGFFYQHLQYFRNATTIYEEIATYCSENKMATGALYAWFLSAEAELQTGNPERAREIGENAFDIANKPNINNNLAAAMLSRLLAESKITMGDLEGAQINIEYTINIAEKNDLHYLYIYSCITLGKLYQEKASSADQTGKEQLCSNAYRNYTKALNIAEKIDNVYLVAKIEKILSNLTAFCKLSGINLEM